MALCPYGLASTIRCAGYFDYILSGVPAQVHREKAKQRLRREKVNSEQAIR